jgi:serine/threonine-protein kinase
VVAGAVLAAVLLNRGGTAAPAITTVAVPDVTNQDAATATQTLQAAGFTVGKTTQVASTAQQKGLVLSTTPASGAQVARGKAVDLTVGAGPNSLAVPDLTGKSASAAITALKQAGFTGNVNQEPKDSLVAKGRVVSTDPTAGSQAAPGDTITLQVSTGTIAMPDVRGKSEAAARQALVAAGLSAGQIKSTNVERDDAPAGSVVDTNPGPGTAIGPGEEINLQIAQPTPPAATTTSTSPVTSSAPASSSSATATPPTVHP